MQRALFIGKVWPEPTSSAAGLRAMQLLEWLKAHAAEVFFASAAGKGRYSADLAGTGINFLSIALNEHSFGEMVNALRPDVVIFDRFMTEEQFGWKVAENCPGALRILDTEDLHGLREARRLAVQEARPVQSTDLGNDIALRELAAIHRCDLTLVISKAEMTVLQDLYNVPSSLLMYLPYLYDTITVETMETWPAFDARSGFVFAGSFRHRPNTDAVHYLQSTIWPLIRRRLPAARLDIYGSYMTADISSQHNPANGFFVHGRAEDISTVFSGARVSLAPLRYGAGVKGKITESWRSGTPCISTGVGAEGLEGSPWPGVIVDDPQHFAQAAVRLHGDEILWTNASRSCADLHNALFDRNAHGTALKQRIYGLLQDPHKHRMAHFTGLILRQQQYHAARWLGKYIEAKNKLTAHETSRTE